MGKISVTMDLWTDPALTPYMAVTGHWIEAVKLVGSDMFKINLRTELLGFHRVPGRHDGDHLGRAFLFILDRVGAAEKVINFSICSTKINQYSFSSLVL
jgi:hypothetical protein